MGDKHERQKKGKPLKDNEMKSNNPSLSKKLKESIQKINESEPEDSNMVLECKIIAEDTKILDIIKQQNRNLEKVKTIIVSIKDQRNCQDLKQPYGNQEDELNEGLLKTGLQTKWLNERGPENPATIISKRYVGGCADQDLPKNVRPIASEEENRFCRNVSKSSSLAGSLCSSATNPDDLFREFFDKVNIMVTYLNESRDLNDQVIHLLKSGRDHLKYCRQCSTSSENCNKLKRICENLRFATNQKLKDISNDQISGHIGLQDRIGAGQNSIKCDCLKDDESSYSTISDPSEIIESDLCCCKSKLESQEVCCCSKQERSNIDPKKMLIMYKRMACELKDLKRKQNKPCFSISEPDSSLKCQIKNLRQRVRLLESENSNAQKLLEKSQDEDAAATRESSGKAETPEALIVETEEQDAEKLEAEKLEGEKLEGEKLEGEKLEGEKLEGEKLEDEKLEDEKLEDEKLEDEKLEDEKLEGEKLEAENKKAENKKTENKKAENKKAEKLQADMAAIRRNSNEIEKENAMQKEQINSLTTELYEIRKEAAALLRKVKDRFEKQLAASVKKIKKLEEDLAVQREKTCIARKDKEKCFEDLECMYCELQKSQLKVKKLQARVNSLMDQIRSQKQMICCSVCKSCKF